MNREVWKPISEYEGCYEVSNLGRVRGLDRVVERSTSPRFVAGVVLSQETMPNGYKSVSLKRCGKQRRFYVHRLVASAFLPNPSNLAEVNHIDEDKANNYVENLEWCDRSHNIKHAGGSKRRVRKRMKPVIQQKDGKTICVYESVNAAARALGVSPTSISRCCRRIKNQHNVKGFGISFASLLVDKPKGNATTKAAKSGA